MDMRDVAQVHRELRAAVLQWERAEQNVVTLFAEFVHGQLYRELGYPDIHGYASEELGFSKSRTSHMLSLVLAMQKLPALQAAVQNQELGWTKAAAIARHATPESAQAWVNVAKRSTRAELRRKLKQAQRPAAAELDFDGGTAASANGEATMSNGAPPKSAAQLERSAAAANSGETEPEPLPTMTEVRLRMNPLQLQRYERAMRRLRGKDPVEALLQALERMPSKPGATRRARCWSCTSARVAARP
jgi:hypothetical protein